MTMMNETARRLFDELKNSGALPSPHGVALTVLELTARPTTSLHDVGRVVKLDPAMAGRILRYANVASGGGQRHIVSVTKAIAFLGLFRVRLIALGFSLIDGYRNGACSGFDYSGFWTMSLATGIAAQKLAAVAQCPPDESFTCGLLAGIGRLAFATAFPDMYADTLRKGLSGAALLDRERAQFGIDHAQLSAEMLNSWGLPEVFTTAVRDHECVAECPSEPGTRAHALCAALNFAMRVGQLLNLEDALRWEQIPSLFNAAARLGMEEKEVPTFVESVAMDWQEWARELKLPAQHYSDLRQLLAAPPTEPRDSAKLTIGIAALRIALLVNDPPRFHALLKSLQSLDLQVDQAVDLTEVRYFLQRDHVDVVIIDAEGADGTALATLRELRIAAGNSLHIIALIPVDAEQAAMQLMLAGAADYLLYNFTEAALIARLSNAQRLVALRSAVRAERELAVSSSGEWARTNRRLLREALTDPLTQLPNRRYGNDRLAHEWDMASRNDLPIACMMIDIDHFKLVNDQRGHGVGDVVLQQIARVLEHCCRRSDVIFRYGGEEFCMICPGTALAEAIRLARRILTTVRDERYGLRDDTFAVTLSIGVAVRMAPMTCPDDLVGKADQALIVAKKAGRNRMSTKRGDKIDKPQLGR